MRLAQRLNRLFAFAVVTSAVISLVLYFILSMAHRKHAFESARLRIQSLYEGQLPFLTQELVNDRYYAAFLRGESLVKEYGGGKLEIGLYRPNGSPIYESNGISEVKGRLSNGNGETGLTAEHAYIHRQIKFGGENIGTILFAQQVDLSGQELLRKPLLASLVILLFALSLLFFLIRRSLSKLVVNPLQEIASAIPDIGPFIQGKANNLTLSKTITSSELTMVASTLISVSTELKNSLEREQKAQLQIERERTISEVARQVAHDIRSPLAALEFICGNLPSLPEDRRLIIRSATSRVRDIANDLLGRSKRIQCDPSANIQTIGTPQLLFYLMDQVLSEKRIEYRHKFGIEIESEYNISSYGVFAAVDPISFKRVLSNLINNGVQAIDKDGKVILRLAEKEGKIVIEVTDSGSGIPAEILPKLMQQGFSYPEGRGTGLGLYHARKSVEMWDGKIAIYSKEGDGTRIRLLLPRCAPPSWFVSQITVSPGQNIVIVDDDTSVHEIWEKRFDGSALAGKLFHFASPSELIGWYNSAHAEQALFLIDHEFLTVGTTGIEIIEKLGIEKQSILVTSRFEEAQVGETSQRAGIRILPKGLAGFVPINIADGCRFADAILLDDDPLVHQVWKAAADIYQKSLTAFTTPKTFLEELSSFSRKCPVYLDVNLGEMDGTQLLPEMESLGFERVYLITGDPPESIKHQSKITAILSKSPPWLDGKGNDDKKVGCT